MLLRLRWHARRHGWRHGLDWRHDCLEYTDRHDYIGGRLPQRRELNRRFVRRLDWKLSELRRERGLDQRRLYDHQLRIGAHLRDLPSS
jgi:hypothetical protein